MTSITFVKLTVGATILTNHDRSRRLSQMLPACRGSSRLRRKALPN